MVLLRRHGATMAGRSLRECVFRSIYACRNAELQSRALGLGHLTTLSPGETELCGSHSLTPRTLGRAWEYWTYRLRKMEAASGGFDAQRPLPDTLPKTQAGKSSARRPKAPAKRAAGRVRKAARAKPR